MDKKLKVGILGGTGMVGQRFISLLENHPWFEVVAIAASPRSAGKKYEEAIGGRWKMTTPMPEAVKNIIVEDVSNVEEVASKVDFVFSAVDMSKDEIKKIEEEYAKTETPVVSNNSAHRWTPDVPMVVPELNPEHLEVIESQKKRLGTTRGFIAVKPNCSIQSYTPALHALKKAGYEPKTVVATTYQAISGAGKTFKDWPEMEGNIIPFIGGEEEKSEQEPLRIWGHIENGEIVKADGHSVSAFLYSMVIQQLYSLPSRRARSLLRKRSSVYGESIRECHRSLSFQAHRSILSSIWRMTTAHRFPWMLTMRTALVYLWDVSVRIQYLITSLLVYPTIQSAVQQAEQFLPQSF